MTGLYRDNPFALLGLRATADGRQVRRRIEELDIQIRLGASLDGLDSDRLRQLRQLVESPAERFQAEMFWLHSDPTAPSPDLNNAASIDAEIQLLLRKAGESAGLDRLLTTHDVAVLRHAAWVDAWNKAPSEMTLAGLQLAHTDWLEALLSPDLERYFEARRQQLGAPSIDIQRTAADQILRSIAVLAADAIDQRNLRGAAALVAFMRRSGLPSSGSEEAVEEATKSLRGEISRGLLALSAAREGERPPEDIVRSERESLVNYVLGPLGRYVLTDPAFTDDALRDRVALAARLVSIDVYNKLGDAPLATALLDHALSIARSTSTLSQLAADIAQVRYQHHSTAAVTAFDAGSSAAAAAHAEIAEEYAESPDTRVQMSTLAGAARKRALAAGINSGKAAILASFDSVRERLAADVARATQFQVISYGREAAPAPTSVQPPQPKSSSSRGRWVAVAAGVLILLIVGVANANSTATRNRPATQAPAVPRAPTQTSAVTRAPAILPPTTPRVTVPPVNTCRDQVRAMESQLTSMESDINAVENQLRSLKSEIESLRSQIRSIEAQYPRGIPSSIYSSYSAMISRLNALVDDHNGRLPRYKSQIADYDALLERRNALARSC